MVVSQQYKQPAEAVTLLERVIKGLADSTQRVTDQPALFLRMHIAQNRLQMGEVEECKTLVEQGKEQLDKMHDVSSDLVVICMCWMLWAHLLSGAWPGWSMQRRCSMWVGTTLCCVGAVAGRPAWCCDWGCGRLQSRLEVCGARHCWGRGGTSWRDTRCEWQP